MIETNSVYYYIAITIAMLIIIPLLLIPTSMAAHALISLCLGYTNFGAVYLSQYFIMFCISVISVIKDSFKLDEV